MSKSIVNQRSVFDRTRSQLRKQLLEFDTISAEGSTNSNTSGSSTIFIYKMFLAQEKALYLNLNQMKSQSDRLLGYFWAPSEFEHDIRTALSSQTATKITAVKDNYDIEPPTFNKTSEFTWVFQEIVDTYGIPLYQEANPTPVSVVSFPFLFGLMFGDLGHGSILAFFGIFLTVFAPQLQKSGFKDMLPIRYFFMLCGLSAFYCGFVYNEFFSLPTNIFQSCYTLDER